MKPVYKTTDGKEWPTATEAEDHEKLCEAESDFVEARKKWAYEVMSRWKTKDGQPFKPRLFRHYYRVWPWHLKPRIEEVSFYTFEVRIDSRGRPEVYIPEMKWERDGLRDTGQLRKIDPRDCYASKTAAWGELLELQEAAIKSARDDAATTRKAILDKRWPRESVDADEKTKGREDP